VVLELLHISDFLVDVQVVGQLNSLSLLTVKGLVNLDNAGEGLAINLFIVVEDHVQAVVDHTHSLGVQGLSGLITGLSQLNVLLRRNALLFQLFSASDHVSGFEGVGVGLVRTLLFNRHLNHVLGNGLQPRDDRVHNFKAQFVVELNWNVISLLNFLQQVLLVETGSRFVSQNMLHLLLAALDFPIKIG